MLRSDLQNYTAASNLEFNNKIKELIKNGRKIHHFGFGQSPFPIPDCFVEGLKQNAHRNEYLPVQGLRELRTKILDFHKHYDHFEHFSPDHIVMGVGSKEILFLAMNVFGGEVLLLCPSWTSYLSQSHLAGRKSLLIPTYFEDRFIPRADVIEKARKILFLFRDVCKKHNIIVISDEIYARLQYDGHYESIANFYPQGTIVTTGFSKWASAGGWRTGYGMFPQELLPFFEAVASGGSHTFTCSPAPMQYALVEGLDHKDELESYMVHCRKILQSAGLFTHRELLAAGAKGHAPESAYYFMPDFDPIRARLQERGMNSGIEMCDKMLEEADVALMPCDPYFLRPAGELSTRFCFINFDGADGLKKSQEMGANPDIDDAFIRRHCAPLIEGVQALTKWMKQ
uniref:Aminotransferase class I/classII domain-containing protein n=1 Tax=Plectus sambesii TaxID=2011161 RepID=A0A914VJ84_9BILA